MSFVRNVLIGGGALSLGFIDWTLRNSREVPIDQKGSLLRRMKEVALASFRAKQIEDQHTAENHIKTVATLSAFPVDEKEFRKKEARRIEEFNKIKTSYFKGYLQKTLQSNDWQNRPYNIHYSIMGETQWNKYYIYVPTPIAVFDFNIQLAIGGGFTFSGDVTNLYDRGSLEKIKNGDYIRCERAAGRGPVLITGTTHPRQCISFHNALLRDAAMVASSVSSDIKINPKDPISATRVHDCNGLECEDVGDLTSIPESLKQQIRNGEFEVHELDYVGGSLRPEQHIGSPGKIYVDSNPRADKDSITRWRYRRKP